MVALTWLRFSNLLKTTWADSGSEKKLNSAVVVMFPMPSWFKIFLTPIPST